MATDDIELHVLSIVRDWANLPTDPQRTDVLQNLWANVLRGPFVFGAQDLANVSIHNLAPIFSAPI